MKLQVVGQTWADRLSPEQLLVATVNIRQSPSRPEAQQVASRYEQNWSR